MTTTLVRARAPVCPYSSHAPRTCSYWGRLEGDPDIAGIGILVSFALSAYITLLLVILNYLVDHQTTQNPIDRRFIDVVIPRSWKNKTSSRKWTRVLEGAVLMYSDTQVATGMAILLSGYVQLSSGISSYHWQAIVNLAWFSSLSHLSTLTALRDYFGLRPKMAAYRAIFMGVVLVLLGTAFGPTGYISQGRTPAVPASCLFSRTAYEDIHTTLNFLSTHGCDGIHSDDIIPYETPLVVLSLAFFVFSYVTRVIRIFAPASKFAQKWLRDKPRERFRGLYTLVTEKIASSPGDRWMSVFQWSLKVIYVLMKSVYEIHGSMLWEIVWLVSALAWGTLRLIALGAISDLPVEARWSFGQILPVLLSLIPLWSIYTLLYESNRSDDTKDQLPLRNSREEVPQAIVNIDSKENSWFYRLVTLTFGFALVIIADLLYQFPSYPINQLVESSNNLNTRGYILEIVVRYTIMLSLCIFVLTIFAALCLGLTNKRITMPERFWKWRNGVGRMSPKSQNRLRECAWAFALIASIVLVGVFDWYIAHNLAWRGRRVEFCGTGPHNSLTDCYSYWGDHDKPDPY